MSKFSIVDIETANPDITSICQIAIVNYENGQITDQWHSLVNPQSYFHPINVSIHGIDEWDVEDAPTIAELAETIKAKFGDNPVCSYGAFDRSSLTRIFPTLQNEWLNIMSVIRRAWAEDFAYSGYGLSNMALHLQIEQLHHHDALDDTLTAGKILLRAFEESQQGLEYWLERVKRPINPELASYTAQKHAGNPEGFLYGETIAFTGELSIPRAKAVELAVAAGCNFVPGVSKKVSLLVLGEQDPTKLRGKDLSAKEAKALELINKGHNIRLLLENDFFNLLKHP